MATANGQLTMKARGALKEKWGLAVGTNFLHWFILAFGSEISLVIGGPFQQGLSRFSLDLSRGKKADIEQLFDGFKGNFANNLIGYLLTCLFVFLWTLLLIVPGIIAAIAYSQTFYLLAEDKNLSGLEAIRRSKAMMRGYKWKFFCMIMRFTGWFLLSIFTLGIGFLFLGPYVNVSLAAFYDDIKANA